MEPIEKDTVPVPPDGSAPTRSTTVTKVDAGARVTGEEVAGALEVAPEFPTYTKETASFAPESARALKTALQIESGDLLLGVPPDVATSFGLAHGDEVLVTLDGKTTTPFHGKIALVTSTPKGPLSRIALVPALRRAANANDHRESLQAGRPNRGDDLRFTAVVIDGKKHIHLISATPPQGPTPAE